MSEKSAIWHDLHGRIVASGIRYFNADELLYFGSSHWSGLDYNTEPPEEYLPHLVAIAKRADRLREACGFPLLVLSAYRSEPYNRAIGGARASYHLTGRALDLSAASAGRRKILKSTAQRMHHTDQLGGGLGVYQTFVHIDTGPKRSW